MRTGFSRSYSRDYSAISAARGDARVDADLHHDFVRALGDELLPTLGQIPAESGRAIAECLFARMNDAGLFYHTPLHILSILDFAAAQVITLRPWQELAIWFHDAIYWPGAAGGDNERNSATFMRSLLNSVVRASTLDQAAVAIEATALYAEPAVPPEHGWILDLDICNFSWDRPNYEVAGQNVAREFVAIHGAANYESGRREFLRAMLSRGALYRTPEFRSRFEQAARENLQRDLGAG